MEQDLHDIDDIFKKAHEQYKDEPGGGVWEKIDTQLNKDDTEKYKRRFIGWKRAAIVLLFFVSVLAIYDTGILTRKNQSLQPLTRNENSNDSKAAHPPEKSSNNSRRKTDTIQTGENSSATRNYPDKKKNPEQKPETSEFTNHTAEVNSVKESVKDMASPPEKDIQKNNLSKQQKNLFRTGNIALFKNPRKKNPAVDSKNPVASANNMNMRSDDSITSKSFKRRMAVAPLDLLYPSKASQFNINPSLMVMSKTLEPFNQKQVSDKKKAHSLVSPRWSIMAFAGNDWRRYHLDNDADVNNGNNQKEAEEITKREKNQRSFSAGFFATRQLSRKWGVKTGLIYSNISMSIGQQELYAAQNNSGSVAYKYIVSTGYAYVQPGFGLPPAVGDSIQSPAGQHNLHLLSLPLMLTYRFQKNKLAVIPSAGLALNYMAKVTVKTEVKDALNKEVVFINGLNGMRSFYFDLMADINFQYEINSMWLLSLFPTVKYAISPITKNNAVKTFPYSAGVGVGLTYKF